MTIKEHAIDAWRVLAPPRGNPHGPLPPMLILLTIVTGAVDAFSYLALGHTLVANMTGNVVFLGFALGGAGGFIWWASVLAIVTFCGGALLGGRIALTKGGHRALHLCAAAITETVLVVAALMVSLVSHAPYDGWSLAVLVAMLGAAMGVQNATARALAVPDLTTTVLTLTITALAADPGGGKSGKIGRRLVPIVGMFLGGLVGALLVTQGHGSWDLGVVLVLLVAVVALSRAASGSREAWTNKR